MTGSYKIYKNIFQYLIKPFFSFLISEVQWKDKQSKLGGWS